MVLDNKLDITDRVKLARAEEKLSKTQAHKLFISGFLNAMDAGSFRVLDSVIYMKGVDASYYYEGYTLYKTQDIALSQDADMKITDLVAKLAWINNRMTIMSGLTLEAYKNA